MSVSFVSLAKVWEATFVSLKGSNVRENADQWKTSQYLHPQRQKEYSQCGCCVHKDIRRPEKAFN